jgi:hypothetical protein
MTTITVEAAMGTTGRDCGFAVGDGVAVGVAVAIGAVAVGSGLFTVP